VEALRAFLVKLDEVTPAIEGAFTFQHVHGSPYSGPTYQVELRDLRAALPVLEEAVREQMEYHKIGGFLGLSDPGGEMEAITALRARCEELEKEPIRGVYARLKRERDEARAEQDVQFEEATHWLEKYNEARAERDEARAERDAAHDDYVRARDEVERLSARLAAADGLADAVRVWLVDSRIPPAKILNDLRAALRKYEEVQP